MASARGYKKLVISGVAQSPLQNNNRGMIDECYHVSVAKYVCQNEGYGPGAACLVDLLQSLVLNRQNQDGNLPGRNRLRWSLIKNLQVPGFSNHNILVLWKSMVLQAAPVKDYLMTFIPASSLFSIWMGFTHSDSNIALHRVLGCQQAPYSTGFGGCPLYC